jgi:F-type H+-transporting ATPase subunit gamma
VVRPQFKNNFMANLAEVQTHISSIVELRDIVGAMRSLAGMRVQEAQRTLPAIRRYAEMVASALAASLLLLPKPQPLQRKTQGSLGLVVFTAEHGFVGGFTERLIDAAEATLKDGDLLFLLGSRGNALALERRRQATWSYPMATRCAAASETVRHLSDELYRHVAQGEITRVDVIYTHYRQGIPPTIERRLLLPLDLTSLKAKQPRYPPLHYMEPVALHEKLMAEYAFALLTEAAVESIASENAARFAAVESAHDNVSKKLDKLHQAEWEARQSEITTEILDLVTGTEAQLQERSRQ